MKEIEKLRVLLPHWIDHNSGHESECLKWSEIARNAGQEKVADYIDDAVKAMKEANSLLQKALDQAGGPSGEDHHQHHHH